MKRFLFIQVMILFAACSSNSNSSKSAEATIDPDTLKSKIDSASSQAHSPASAVTNGTEKLIGIWGKSDSENASFEISKATFYYPEHDKYYKYRIDGDSVRIKYDDYEEIFAFKFKGRDTLILNGLYGEQVYKRRK